MRFLAHALLAIFFADPLCGDLAPHPELSDRFIDHRDGFSVEYSPGDETYVEAVFEAIEPFRKLLLSPRLSPEPDTFLPLSALDMRARREELLAAIAASIGLDEATELQAQAYDTFLNYYEWTENTIQPVKRLAQNLRPQGVTIWTKEVLERRLQDGESILNFSYNAELDEIEYSFSFELPPANRERTQAISRAMKNTTLAHRFSRNDADGVSSFTASIDLGSQSLVTPDPEPLPEFKSLLPEDNDKPLIIPSYLYPFIIEPTSDRLPRESAKDFAEHISAALGDPTPIPQFRDSQFVAVILHETAEVGLIDRYINSSDRRWLCDGTANWVSWKVARYFAGEDFARWVYDLDAQITHYADLQRQIRLSRWHAAERDAEVDMEERLQKAHYAFASRAIFAFAKEEGDAAIAKLWIEIGQTPRGKTDMKTASAAYRKLTGKRLNQLIKQAERAPIAKPAGPSAKPLQ